MYFDKTFSNGSIYSDTPMTLNIKMSGTGSVILASITKRRKTGSVIHYTNKL